MSPEVAARNAWILTRVNDEREVDRWREAYEKTVGPPPPNAVPLPVVYA